MAQARYEQDFAAWTAEQSRLLREGRLVELDLAHLAEEIEDMGKNSQRALLSRLQELLLHLLKWQYQPGRRGNRWRASIRKQRQGIEDLLEDSPSLQPRLAAAYGKCYARARLDAADETGLALTTFAESCPWSLDEVLDPAWLPD